MDLFLSTRLVVDTGMNALGCAEALIDLVILIVAVN